MNSVEVQPLLLYRNEARWRKQNTTPCWRKEITVGAISDQQMRGTGHTPLECWVSWRHCWALGEGGGNTTYGENQQTNKRDKKKNLKVHILK